MRRPDRRRARLDRLARRADRHLAGAVLLLERLAGAVADRADLRAPVHLAGYDDALRRNASSGTRSSGMYRTFSTRSACDAPHPRPQRRDTRQPSRSTRICSAQHASARAHRGEQQRARRPRHRAPAAPSRRRFADRCAAVERRDRRTRRSERRRRQRSTRRPGIVHGSARQRRRRRRRVAVGPAQHVELVIEVDDRVSRALTPGPQERRYQHHRPQHCQNDQDRQRQDLSTASV